MSLTTIILASTAAGVVIGLLGAFIGLAIYLRQPRR